MSGAEVRPAATVVIMRDGPLGLEVLLTVRPRHLRFMGGASVFPGGAVCTEDLDPRWAQASRLSGEAAAQALSIEDPAHALGTYVCALREAFEEVGFLIGSGSVDAIPRHGAADPVRFLEACLEKGVVLGTDRLSPAGRWVTPLGSPLRFDARFFLAVAPDGWEPVPDPSEVEACAWVTPAESLAAVASGARLMAPPTVEMLQRLERYHSTEESIGAFAAESLQGSGNVLSVRVSPLVHVVLAPNAGVMTGPGTNTYVVGSGPYLVIDPATDDDEYIVAVLRAAGGDVDQILVTHRHSDHVGGAERLAGETGAPVRAFGTAPAGSSDVVPLDDEGVVAVPGVELVALHTPGHASDHLCFYLRGAASLFSGDNIMGEGTAVIAPPDGNMADYLASLERLRKLHIDRIYPGHWKPLDGGRAVIDGYLAHRREREAKILAAVASGATLDEIVERAYSDTPAHLHPVARLSALAHLEALAEKQEVEGSEDRWRIVTKE